jgi:hypothetical protein
MSNLQKFFTNSAATSNAYIFGRTDSIWADSYGNSFRLHDGHAWYTNVRVAVSAGTCWTFVIRLFRDPNSSGATCCCSRFGHERNDDAKAKPPECNIEHGSAKPAGDCGGLADATATAWRLCISIDGRQVAVHRWCARGGSGRKHAVESQASKLNV